MLKRSILFSFAILIYSISFAQFKYGLKIGLTQSFVKDRPRESNEDMNLKGGFQVGVTTDFVLKKNLGLRPSIQFTQKGYRSVEGNPRGPFYWNRNLSTAYLELPIDVVYNVYLNKCAGIVIGTGPVVGAGLLGRLKTIFAHTDSLQVLHTENSTDNQTFKSQIDKKLDFGWDFLIGLQYDKLTISANFNYSFLNTIKDPPQSLKNRSFALTVGYFFTRKSNRTN